MSDRLRADARACDLFRTRAALSEMIERCQRAEARLTEVLVELDRVRAENERLKSRRIAA